MLEGLNKTKKREKSSSSDDGENEVIEGDYFMLRKKGEIGLIKE